MNTAPVTTTLADNGVALMPVVIGGVTLPAGSTAVQRLEAHAKAGTQSQFHTDHNVTGMSAAAANPAPSPKALEKQNAMPTPEAQAQKIAEFDAEMQAKGLQRTPGEGAPAGEIDTVGIEKLNARYKELMKGLESTAGNRDNGKSTIDSIRKQYQQELAEFYNGRRLSETRAQFQARQAKPATPAATGAAWSTPGENGARTLTAAGTKMQNDLLAEYKALPAAQKTAATSRDYQIGVLKTIANERGMVSTAHIDAKFLSGYTLPKGEFVTPEIIHDLARAKAIGLTQAQVNKIIESERS